MENNERERKSEKEKALYKQILIELWINPQVYHIFFSSTHAKCVYSNLVDIKSTNSMELEQIEQL